MCSDDELDFMYIYICVCVCVRVCIQIANVKLKSCAVVMKGEEKRKCGVILTDITQNVFYI